MARQPRGGRGSPGLLRRCRLGRVRRVFFIVMAMLWGAFFALAVTSPGTLDSVWAWTGDLWWPLQIAVWIVFLPWMIGLAIWQADWSAGIRWAAILVLAFGWTMLSYPRKK